MSWTHLRQISQCLCCIFLSIKTIILRWRWTESRRMTFAKYCGSYLHRGAQRLRSFRVALRCEWQGGTLLAWRGHWDCEGRYFCGTLDGCDPNMLLRSFEICIDLFNRNFWGDVNEATFDMTDGSQLIPLTWRRSWRPWRWSCRWSPQRSQGGLRKSSASVALRLCKSFHSTWCIRSVWLQLFLPDSRVRISFLIICVWTSNSQYINLQRK